MRGVPQTKCCGTPRATTIERTSLKKRVLTAMIAVAMAGVVLLVGIASVAAQQNGPSVTRSFNPASVAPGGMVTVTIQVANYGGIGRVTETLPAGFVYVSSTHDLEGVSVNGQEVRFTLQGHSSVAYTVTASRTAGSHTFSGMLRDSDRANHTVGGATGVTVTAPAGPSVTRSFNPASVGPRRDGDGHHPGRQLRGHRTGNGDAARRVRLRIQHPRLGGSECERPGGSVHAARAFLRRLHGHRLQDGGVPHLLGNAQGLRPGQPHGRRRYGRDGDRSCWAQRHPELQPGIGGPRRGW